MEFLLSFFRGHFLRLPTYAHLQLVSFAAVIRVVTRHATLLPGGALRDVMLMDVEVIRDALKSTVI